MTSGAIFVYVTAPSAGVAEKIALAAVESGLAACANIFSGMQSIYRWQGKTARAEEIVLILKTQAAHFNRLEACIRSLHPYETPCIVALPVSTGHQSYLDWITAETQTAE